MIDRDAVLAHLQAALADVEFERQQFEAGTVVVTLHAVPSRDYLQLLVHDQEPPNKMWQRWYEQSFECLDAHTSCMRWSQSYADQVCRFKR